MLFLFRLCFELSEILLFILQWKSWNFEICDIDISVLGLLTGEGILESDDFVWNLVSEGFRELYSVFFKAGSLLPNFT